MTDKATVHQLIEALPAAKLAAAARLLDYLQEVDQAEAEALLDTLQQISRVRVMHAFQGPSPLYDTDFYAWTQGQAAALRHEETAVLDWEHLAEEIEDLGSNRQSAIERQLVRLLLHLLKLRYDQDIRPRRGWQVTVADAREQIDRKAKGSLQHHPEAYLPVAYRLARRKAALATGRPLSTFPEVCPWTLAQVLDEDFWTAAEGAGSGDAVS